MRRGPEIIRIVIFNQKLRYRSTCETRAYSTTIQYLTISASLLSFYANIRVYNGHFWRCTIYRHVSAFRTVCSERNVSTPWRRTLPTKRNQTRSNCNNNVIYGRHLRQIARGRGWRRWRVPDVRRKIQSSMTGHLFSNPRGWRDV